MKTFAASLAALSLVGSALGAAVPTVKKVSGPVKTDSYIVTLKSGANREAHVSSLKGVAERDSSAFLKITHADWNPDVFNGYAVTARGAALTHILTSLDVASVEQDGIASVNYSEDEVDARALTDEEFEEAEKRASLEARGSRGSGVVVYGIDTGIYTAHNCFGGRASFGAVYGGYAAQDGNGHGTHTAGTAVGTSYGVATSATIVAVKVLSDSGSGSNSDVISGINYAYNTYRSNGKPSVATMSLGGGANSAVDSAVSNAISGGLHFTVAAGNDGADAKNTSPARVTAANTIGAVDSSNTIAYFSNYGSVVDVFALGVNVLSAWIGSPSATNTISGTSMATPKVAGILATVLSEYGQVSPSSLSSSLKSHASASVRGQPSGTTNLLAQLW